MKDDLMLKNYLNVYISEKLKLKCGKVLLKTSVFKSVGIFNAYLTMQPK